MKRRFNKYEKKEHQEYKLRNAMAGSGLFVYENNTRGDLTLPKPTESGQRKIAPNQKFQGDSYYMAWVKPPLSLLKYIECITPETRPELQENTMSEEKLILDQPETITQKGKVEHVVPKQINDVNDNSQQQDVLLTEDPMDGVSIIMG